MKRIISALQILLSVSQFVVAQPADGCADHPLIQRFEGSVLAWCDMDEYRAYQIALGPQTAYRHIDEWLEVNGRLYRMYYELSGPKTVTEVYQNYLDAVQSGGMEVLAKGLVPESNVSKAVGGKTMLGTAYAANPLPTGEGINLFHGTSTSGGTGYLVAKLRQPAATVYLILMVYQHRQDEVLTMIDIVEEEEMEQNQVQIDADYLADRLLREGKVVLSGLSFHHDQATLTDASKPAIEEIVKLLRDQPDLQVFIVGHTDLSGELGYNLELSERRAAHVVQILTLEHGIDPDRLEAHGVGPLSPIIHQDKQTDIYTNRRVELVQR